MKINDAVKNPKKILFAIGMHGGFKFLNDRTYLKMMYWSGLGKKLNLDNPITFNEKIQWLKIHNTDPVYTIMVDKYEVKKYVSNIIGEKYSTVKYYMESMKKSGVIKREGSSQKGKWVIL